VAGSEQAVISQHKLAVASNLVIFVNEGTAIIPVNIIFVVIKVC